MMLDILTHPLITVQTKEIRTRMNLPQVLEACVQDNVEDFPNLAAYQHHPWHAFLVQTAAQAMVNAGLTRPPASEEEWRTILRQLTQERFPSHEPWELLNQDMTKPAFMQPPVSRPELAAPFRKKLIATPDGIDLTVASRNHDVKLDILQEPEPDHWIFALISCQTSNGFSGPNLRRISRMNGSYANRHAFSITPSTRWGPHFQRDVTILATAHQGQQVEDLLLWTRDWDGRKEDQIPIDSLQPLPLYVEICRRIRLSNDRNGRIHAMRATSASERIDDQGRKGKVEDPWSLTQEDKATTISGAGFDCQHICNYLDPAKNILPLLARHHPETDGDQPMHLVARTLIRDQGKTRGYHEATIPISNQTAAMLDLGTKQEELARVAQERIQTVSSLQFTLARAAFAYVHAKPPPTKRADFPKSILKSAEQLEFAATQDFWTELQKELECPEPPAERERWLQENIVPKAIQALKNVQERSTTNRHTKYRAIHLSNAIFFSHIRKLLREDEPTNQQQEEEAK